ncbi:hypothetical protein E2C01_055618 [Portunus trituberculatus]|uniref:Uncharacterized protein n=1 Tax=Portunus trituberculatus TaxID=210409 RepID=A0A5B7GW16_PORTR|nr:hypothetical protein [Portunus trituberculatus]
MCFPRLVPHTDSTRGWITIAFSTYPFQDLKCLHAGTCYRTPNISLFCQRKKKKTRKEKINFALNRQESGQQARLLTGSYTASRFISSSFPFYLALEAARAIEETPFVPPPAYSVPDLLNAPFLLYMKASGNVYVSKGSKDVFEAPGSSPDEPAALEEEEAPPMWEGAPQGTRSLASKILQ